MAPKLANQNAPVWKRLRSFFEKPWAEKRSSFGSRWMRFLPGVPFPIRLSNGCWWLARNDACGAGMLEGRFEQAEREFLESYLRPGMTVLDIGAHHGIYTLLASRRVGVEGRVIAFEPSPRELRHLNWHVKLNGCRNVTIISCALASAEGASKLFVVEGKETGCNSLRRPEVDGPTREVVVRVRRLDEVLEQLSVEHIDLIKLDAEGGELEILRGAGKLLKRTPRPVILAEVQELRTRPWGYKANEIIRYLSERRYHWFRPHESGQLDTIEEEQMEYDGNFVAIPCEVTEELFSRLSVTQKPMSTVLAASA